MRTKIFKKMKNVICLLILTFVKFNIAQILDQPEQIHLSYGKSENGLSTIVVTWVTRTNVDESIVEYGVSGLTEEAVGTQQVFTDDSKATIYMHRVWLKNLKPGQHYFYHCGGPTGWSDVYYFQAMPAGGDWSPRLAVFGDMGNKNAQSLGRLQEETQRGRIDAILHVGDFAYNMDTNQGEVGNAFMNQIQSVAAYVPYMTCVGNHEQAYNFSHYVNRFTMPGGEGHGLFYSFDIGPAHIIGFSSEFYYFVEYGWQQIINQYKWLEEDLREANKPENRAQRPWIITMCHRPMYCSNSNDPEHCPNLDNFIRVGIPIDRAYSVEDLLFKYGVDLHFQAHEHSYERMWPVYNLTVCNGSSDNPYLNPRAPVHIVTGSGGCQEGVDPFIGIPHPWSAFHSDDYGFTHMTIINGTHLSLEQVSDDQGGVVIDKMMLIKHIHGPGTYDCPTGPVPPTVKSQPRKPSFKVVN